MTIAVGDTIPDVELRIMSEDGPQAVRTGDALGKGKVLLFAVPGAFTPGCSKIHLPGYLEGLEELKERGVDTVACVSINDSWVMEAWAGAQGVDGRILMLADGNGEFTKAMGLKIDLERAGLGLRSQRYAAIVEGGVVTSLEVEPAPGVDVSSCQSMLARL